jgi:CoA:oxalate CoA-transferase
MSRLLEGITVLDFSRQLAGPFCTMILCDLGARVIKVESPKGDPARISGPFINNVSCYFTSINRGKESICINLKHPEAKEIILQLARNADILVENFRPGVMKRLGLDAESIRNVNQTIIYVSCTGFGNSGPFSNRPAYDIIVQAMGGIMSVTGQQGGRPTRVGVSQADMIAGLYAVISILASLFHRNVKRKGNDIDVSMLDCQLSLMWHPLATWCATEKDPVLIGNSHPAIVPFDTYTCKDGEIAIACGPEDQWWERLCSVIGLSYLVKEPSFSSLEQRIMHRDEITDILNNTFKKKLVSEWEELLIANDIPCSKVNKVSDLLQCPQIVHRNSIQELEQKGLGTLKIPGVPFKVDGKNFEVTHPAPSIGQHTKEILINFTDFSEAEIQQFYNRGIVY